MSQKFASLLNGEAVIVGRPRFSDAASEWVHSGRNLGPTIRVITAGAIVEALLAVHSGRWTREDARAALLSAVHVDAARVLQVLEHTGQRT